MKSFVAIDFETANRNLSSVCSIGLVFVEDAQIVDTYYQLIKPTPNFYSRFNTEIHRMTKTDTETAPLFPQVWAEVAPRLAGKPLVIAVSMKAVYVLCWQRIICLLTKIAFFAPVIKHAKYFRNCQTTNSTPLPAILDLI